MTDNMPSPAPLTDALIERHMHESGALAEEIGFHPGPEWRDHSARQVSELIDHARTLERRLREAEETIRQHNVACDAACDGKRRCGYERYKRRCPDCPVEWKIEYAALSGREQNAAPQNSDTARPETESAPVNHSAAAAPSRGEE